jgi:precorrin-6Y C5,15-methyltransferase (decarboxylating)
VASLSAGGLRLGLEFASMKKTVHIMGVGISPDDLSPRCKDLIAQADLLAGGDRHLEAFTEAKGDRVSFSDGLKPALDRIQATREAGGRVVVLASGDPLYFGIGSYLGRQLGRDAITVHPNVSAVAAAFARLGLSWQDAGVISFHGRPRETGLASLLQRHDSVAVYTDPRRNPAWLAERLVAMGYGKAAFHVFEAMGSSDERQTDTTAENARGRSFAEPNLVIIRPSKDRSEKPPSLHTGMPDDLFVHEKGLITKREVRAVTLAKLAPGPEMVFWDLGAGCGSVAVEAAATMPGGRLFAVEQHAERVADIHANIRRFGVTGLSVIEATLPDGLDELPDPHRIFIGGGGRRLPEIIRKAGRRLLPGGILVANTVLVNNLTAATEAMEGIGLETEAVQLQVSRTRRMPWSRRFEALNPVWIITGSRKES